MSPNFKGAAKFHKKFFKNYVYANGITVEIRQPVAKSASGGSDVAKVLGTEERETGVGDVSTVVGILVGAQTVDNARQSAQRHTESSVLGRLSDADIVLKVYLEDVLLDTSKPWSRTRFHTSKEVEVQGTRYQFLRIERTGLPPAGPYAGYVGLKTIGDNA